MVYWAFVKVVSIPSLRFLPLYLQEVSEKSLCHNYVLLFICLLRCEKHGARFMGAWYAI